MQPEKIFWGKVTDFQKFPPDKSNKEGIFCTMPVTKLTYGASGGTGATARMNTCGSFGVPQRYGCYMIESVLSRVQSMADLLAEKFYTNLVGKVEFKQAVSAAAVLYIVIYGVLIMLGMIPATGGDVIMRLIKLGIIWACLISGWSFFYEYFGKAFAEGVNDVVSLFSSASQGVPYASINASGNMTALPLAPFFAPLGYMFSYKWFIMMAAVIFTGLFGIVIVGLLVVCMLMFMWTVVGALVTYAKAIVGLKLMLGLAPIFIALKMFNRTEEHFRAWVNQLLTFFLQPMLLFSFLALFMNLISQSIGSIIDRTEYCFVPWVSIPGYTEKWKWFRAATCPSKTSSGATVTNCTPDNLEAYSGSWNMEGPFEGIATAPNFPIDVTEVILLAIFCFLCYQYTQMVARIAQDLSGGIANSTVSGAEVSQFLRGKLFGGGLGDSAASAGRRFSGTAADTFASVASAVGGRKGGEDFAQVSASQVKGYTEGEANEFLRNRNKQGKGAAANAQANKGAPRQNTTDKLPFGAKPYKEGDPLIQVATETGANKERNEELEKIRREEIEKMENTAAPTAEEKAKMEQRASGAGMDDAQKSALWEKEEKTLKDFAKNVEELEQAAKFGDKSAAKDLDQVRREMEEIAKARTKRGEGPKDA